MMAASRESLDTIRQVGSFEANPGSADIGYLLGMNSYASNANTDSINA